MATTTSRARSRRRNPRGEGDRLRAELLDATAQLLSSTGDADQVSIRAVAAACGVTPPSVYRHFPDKDALLRAAANEQFRVFRRHLADAAAAGTDPFDALRRMGRAYLTFAREQPGHYAVLFGPACPAPTTGFVPDADSGDDQGVGALDDLVAVVGRCLEASGSQRDPFAVALVVWCSLHGLAEQQARMSALPWPDDDALLDAVALAVGRIG
jgi:AcrR family transcriptional regulator